MVTKQTAVGPMLDVFIEFGFNLQILEVVLCLNTTIASVLINIVNVLIKFNDVFCLAFYSLVLLGL